MSSGAVSIPLLRRFRRQATTATFEERVHGPVRIPATAATRGTLAAGRLDAFFATGALALVDEGAFRDDPKEWVVTCTRIVPRNPSTARLRATARGCRT